MNATLQPLAPSTRASRSPLEPTKDRLIPEEPPSAQTNGLTMQEKLPADPASDLPGDHLMVDDQRLRVVGQPHAEQAPPPVAHGRASTHASNGDGQLHERETAPDVQSTPDNHKPSDVGLIVELWRQRQDLRRAEGRLNLQCQAICRRACGGDKMEAAKLWAAIRKDPAVNFGLSMILQPYQGAMASLSSSARAIESQLEKLARQTSLWSTWARDVRGVAELSLAGLIGEAARSPGEYRSVSALWKRMGLAVINGERQRLKSGDDALIHGYSPNRRAFAYVLSTNLMRSQRTGDPYRDLYDRRKALELERGLPKAHAHNRALRYMVKSLLKDAWRADRAA